MLPTQYKESRTYFMDFEFKVTEDTFIPRPETEILVERVVETSSWPVRRTSLNILDMGTGCGNIAISLTKYIHRSKITALDISEKALSVARENAIKYACADRINFIKSNVFENLDKHKYKNFFDIIVSNPPYVSGKDMQALPPEVKAEPPGALYGGEDGLYFYRRIIKGAPYYLREGGVLATEIGYDQAHAVGDMLEESGFVHIELIKDYNGIERIAIGKWIS